MRAFLARRGSELAGLVLAGLAVALGAALGSYDLRDPSWFVATADPPRNLMGAPGALIADPLLRSLGLGAWGLVALLVVWGGRLVLHRGEGRVWSRFTLGILAMPLVSTFAAAHAPWASWPFGEAGLGGLLGDVLLGELLRALPMAPAAALPWVTLALGVCALLAAGVALGLDRAETATLARGFGAGLATAARAGARALRGLGGFAGMAAARAEQAAKGPRSSRVPPPPPVGRRARREPVFDPEAAEDAVVIEAPPAVAAPPRKPLKQSRRAEAETQPRFDFDAAPAARYDAPPLALLAPPRPGAAPPLSAEALDESARMLESVLDDYGVRGEISAVRPGPVVTLYELEPAPGTKASRVIGLSDDIARSMCALSARVSTVPGRNVIGIELPNPHREKVWLREMLAASAFGDAGYPLALALGKDIAGEPVVANLARMPHLLIAGTTGSGKSVAINTMILSLLYRLSPEECRLIMIDPKMLELSVYDGIPHLLAPVVTDPKKAVVALKWTVAEMEDRYRKMSKLGVRNIDGYNARVREALANAEPFTRTVQTGFD
ncbi:MAG: DNA translocase FtsK, partial [Rhodobacteraceae bacterium]